MGAVIQAAGGLLWRRTAAGPAEVCLIHRKRYQDWALPKGKLHRDEHPLAAAVREVREEAGTQVRPQLPLPAARYRVDGMPKVVHYWLMVATAAPEFEPNAEVDALAWLPAAAAVRRLTYPHDALLVRRWEQLPEVTSVVLLVRHAFAGERDRWAGPDSARPLTAAGVAEAQRLCRLLRLFAPQRLVSATPERCRQTLAPLAERSGLPVAVDAAFDESAADPAAAAAHLRDLAGAAASTVVCSQGKVVGPVLRELSGDPRYASLATAKGDGWLLPFCGTLPLAPAPLAVGPPARRPDRQ